MAIERQIKEDFTITSKPMYGLAGLVIVGLLFCCFTINEWRYWLFFIAVAMVLAGATWLAVRSACRNMEAGPKWFLTEEGLQHVYESGKGRMIPWQRIRNMVWRRYNGLIVRWGGKESKRSVSSFQREFVYRQRKTVLRIQEDQARELISIWQKRSA